MGLDALEQCHLDKVFFVPTRPWQKTARASEEDRAAMLSMALTSYQDKLVVDRRELERTGASYSIDTLYSFRQEFGPADFCSRPRFESDAKRSYRARTKRAGALLFNCHSQSFV